MRQRWHPKARHTIILTKVPANINDYTAYMCSTDTKTKSFKTLATKMNQNKDLVSKYNFAVCIIHILSITKYALPRTISLRW